MTNKYRNQKTVVDGITFDSKAEARRYRELKLLERGKVISDLELQPKFPLFCNGEKICDYVADFTYQEEDGRVIVEDVKGVQTPVFKLKAKLFKANFGGEIKIVNYSGKHIFHHPV